MEYKTRDLGEAAALLTKDIKIVRLDKDPQGYYWFVFESNLAKSVADMYWFGGLLVNAKRHEDNRALLTDRLHILRKGLS